MKNSEYWQERFIQLNDALFGDSEEAARSLALEYKKAALSVEKDIEVWLRRIAANNNVTMTEARRLLNTSEMDEFHWTVFEYIEKGEENAINSQWLKQLENASARVHINRYEAMLLQIRHNIEMLANTQHKSMMELNSDLFTQGYYQTIYEIQKGFGQGASFKSLNTDLINTVAAKPWAMDGKNFSERIWSNKERLINELQSNLTQSFIRGDSPDKAIKAVSDRLNVSKHQAGRLVMTEAAYFSAEGQRRAFNELGVDKYEIVATLDGKTSDICRELDGSVLDMKDYQAGVTAPPFHCWCRTVTVPYFEDNYTERAARDEDGNIYYVPGDINYKDWYNKYVEKPEVQALKKKAKELGIQGRINMNPTKLDVSSLTFDDKHINKDRLHKVTGEDAGAFIEKAMFSITRWNGKFENYISKNGAAYVNLNKKEIRTAFKTVEYDNKLKTLIEEWVKNE